MNPNVSIRIPHVWEFYPDRFLIGEKIKVLRDKNGSSEFEIIRTPLFG